MPEEPARARRGVYRQAWDRAGSLLVRYVAHYAEDAEFGEALVRLFAGYGTSDGQVGLLAARELWQFAPICWQDGNHGTWARAYLKELIATAERFGLDRLSRGDVRLTVDPHDPTDELRLGRGHELIHTWCVQRAIADSSGYDWPPGALVSCVGAGGALPDVGEIIDRQRFEVQGPDGMRVEIIDERRAPLVTIAFSNRWDPRSESRAAARRGIVDLLMAELDAKLAAIEATARAAGYDDREGEEIERDVTWLFMKVRHRLTYGEIVQWTNLKHPDWFGRRGRKDRSGYGDPDARRIMVAVTRMCARLGVDH